MSEVEGHDKAGAVCSGDEADDKGDRIPRGRGGSKPHSTPQTLKWLEENYEIAEGVCIPRSTLYYHYLDFCDANDTQPVNAASFGKMVAYSPRSKLGTLLPEFPDIKDIKIPPGVEEGKVQNFLLHFWQGMPPHIVPILDSSTIVMLVGVCDSILYRAIASVLMPTVLQALPDSLTQVIRRFAKQLDDWLKTALSSLPEGLQNIKFDLARRFAQVLRRQTSLNHLCQAARSVLQSPDITGQLLDDWLSVDLNSIVKQTLYTMDQYTARDHTLISNLCGEFERLLEEQAPIESFIEWLDGMVDKCVVKPSAKPTKSLRQIARQFLLMWSCFGTRVIRDMTLHSAPSFGSFHLLHLMFDDYVLYRIEALYSQERASDFLKIVRGEEVCGSPADELILPDPSAIKDGLVPLTSPGAYCGGQAGAVYQDRMSVITSSRHILPDAQEKIRNEELWERAGQEPVAKQILRRKWGWIGHTLRKPASSTKRQALTWNPQGKRKRGQPRNSLRRDTEAELCKQVTNWTGVAEVAHQNPAAEHGHTDEHHKVINATFLHGTKVRCHRSDFCL
nr:hypothetical protein BaRGS_028663 [Batillaria attramentaria]